MCFALGSPDLQDLRSQEQNSQLALPASSRAMAAGPRLDSALHYPPSQPPWGPLRAEGAQDPMPSMPAPPPGPLRAEGAQDPIPSTQWTTRRSLFPGHGSSQTGQNPSASSRRCGVAPEVREPHLLTQVMLKPRCRSALNSPRRASP